MKMHNCESIISNLDYTSFKKKSREDEMTTLFMFSADISTKKGVCPAFIIKYSTSFTLVCMYSKNGSGTWNNLCATVLNSCTDDELLISKVYISYRKE